MKLLEMLYKKNSGNTPLLRGLTLSKLEEYLRRYSNTFEVSLCAHMVRHAGPSHDAHYNKVGIEDIRIRGRWMCIESCRRYSKPAKLLRALAALPAPMLSQANRAKQTLVPRLVNEFAKII